MNKDPLAREYLIDSVLVNLIREAENIEKNESTKPEEDSISIILTVGGVLVAGELVGRNAWFDEQFGPVQPAETGTQVDVAPVPSEVSVSEAGDTEDENERRFVHLRNAKFYQGGKVIPSEGIGFFWRGRLVAVDGFMLGSLETVSRKPTPRTIEINGARIRIE